MYDLTAVRKRTFFRNPVGVGALCQEHDCKQLCKRIVNTFALFNLTLLEAERSGAERGFQKRRAAYGRREILRFSSCSVAVSISAIL